MNHDDTEDTFEPLGSAVNRILERIAGQIRDRREQEPDDDE